MENTVGQISRIGGINIVEANVDFVACDWKDEFDNVEIDELVNKWPCLNLMLVFPDIEHIVDGKIAVVCPRSAISWVHANAIKLHDSDCDGYYWNGERIVGLDANREEVPLIAA